MTFYGQTQEPAKPRPLRRFKYRIHDGGSEQDIQAHEIYFYEHGRIGFWNGTGDDRVLVLATKAFQVREVTG